MADKETAHQKEVSFLKSIIQKAKKWFPLFQELVYMEEFCLKVGFNERQTATLISGKPLFYEGELYSEEHRRKFMTERAGFQVVKDPARTCNQWASDWRMVQGTVRQAVFIHSEDGYIAS